MIFTIRRNPQNQEPKELYPFPDNDDSQDQLDKYTKPGPEELHKQYITNDRYGHQDT